MTARKPVPRGRARGIERSDREGPFVLETGLPPFGELSPGERHWLREAWDIARDEAPIRLVDPFRQDRPFHAELLGGLALDLIVPDHELPLPLPKEIDRDHLTREISHVCLMSGLDPNGAPGARSLLASATFLAARRKLETAELVSLIDALLIVPSDDADLVSPSHSAGARETVLKLTADESYPARNRLALALAALGSNVLRGQDRRSLMDTLCGSRALPVPAEQVLRRIVTRQPLFSPFDGIDPRGAVNCGPEQIPPLEQLQEKLRDPAFLQNARELLSQIDACIPWLQSPAGARLAQDIVAELIGDIVTDTLESSNRLTGGLPPLPDLSIELLDRLQSAGAPSVLPALLVSAIYSVVAALPNEDINRVLQARPSRRRKKEAQDAVSRSASLDGVSGKVAADATNALRTDVVPLLRETAAELATASSVQLSSHADELSRALLQLRAGGHFELSPSLTLCLGGQQPWVRSRLHRLAAPGVQARAARLLEAAGESRVSLAHCAAAWEPMHVMLTGPELPWLIQLVAECPKLFTRDTRDILGRAAQAGIGGPADPIPTLLFEVEIKRARRTVELRVDQSLDDLHWAVIDALGWGELALFLFENDREELETEMPFYLADLEEGAAFEYAFQGPGKAVTLLVSGSGKGKTEPGATYPRLVASKGESPDLASLAGSPY